jgi:hypothetical protein
MSDVMVEKGMKTLEPVELKLKQASAVLGVTRKELQNLVQFGVVKPRRRKGVFFFDTATLCQAQVAEYLKSALGTPTNRLSAFAEAFSEWMKTVPGQPDAVVFKSHVPYSALLIEVKVPFKDLYERLEQRLRRVDLYRDLPRGRKRPGWRQDFLSAINEAAQDLDNISPEEIQQLVRDHRKRKKQQPEISVVAETAGV